MHAVLRGDRHGMAGDGPGRSRSRRDVRRSVATVRVPGGSTRRRNSCSPRAAVAGGVADDPSLGNRIRHARSRRGVRPRSPAPAPLRPPLGPGVRRLRRRAYAGCAAPCTSPGRPARRWRPKWPSPWYVARRAADGRIDAPRLATWDRSSEPVWTTGPASSPSRAASTCSVRRAAEPAPRFTIFVAMSDLYTISSSPRAPGVRVSGTIGGTRSRSSASHRSRYVRGHAPLEPWNRSAPSGRRERTRSNQLTLRDAHGPTPRVVDLRGRDGSAATFGVALGGDRAAPGRERARAEKIARVEASG